MTKCDCYVYPTASDKSRNEFIDLLVKEANLDREKVVIFLNTNDQFVFNQIEKEHAITIISEFEKLDIIGSIGTLDKYYQNKFKTFKYGFVPTWNWVAAIFGWPWVLFKGLWGKIAIYWMAEWVLDKVIPEETFGLFAWLISFIYLGMFGTYDYYLKKVKGEAFWPKVQYIKSKLLFWIVFLVFIGYVLIYPLIHHSMYISNIESHKVSRFVRDDFIFETIPKEWVVYENPPASFSVNISRPMSKTGTEELSCCEFPDAKLIGIVEKRQPTESQDKQNAESIGLIGLVVKNPGLFQKFGNVQNQFIEKIASSMVGGDKYPFFMRWIERGIPQSIPQISYEEIDGREWGKAANVIQIKIMGAEAKSYMTVYWTVANNKAVLFFSESFSPFKDEIDNEVKEFLRSFTIR